MIRCTDTEALAEMKWFIVVGVAIIGFAAIADSKSVEVNIYIFFLKNVFNSKFLLYHLYFVVYVVHFILMIFPILLNGIRKNNET